MLFFFSFFFKVREQKSNDWRVNEKGKKKKALTKSGMEKPTPVS